MMSSSRRCKEFCIGPINMANGRCSFSHYIESIDRLMESMSEKHKARVVSTLFGYLLHLLYIMQSKLVLDVLLFFWDDEEKGFSFGKTLVPSVGTNIVLIFGLRATSNDMSC